MKEYYSREKLSAGISGLDEILQGGLISNRFYLIEGDPGAGKTTLALQFLMEGVARGERCLYITLSESADELREVADSHGWNLDGIDICDMVGSEGEFAPDAQYTMFHPSEVELGERTNRILHEIATSRPQRMVLDSLSEMRMLAQNPLRYRRQILAFKSFLNNRNCTFLLLDDRTVTAQDLQLQSVVHGVIALEQLAPEFGAERRRLRVIKYRGSQYSGGYHDFKICQGGLQVYPRLVALEHRDSSSRKVLKSGIPELDKLAGGGLECGSSMLLLGPAGTGKSSIAIQYALAAANGGSRSALFIFDEAKATLVERCSAIGLNLKSHISSGKVSIHQIDPAELSPGEFTNLVRREVENRDDPAQVVVIDSLNGYLNAMPEERFLTTQMHELLTYLGQMGVLTLLVVAQNGLIGASLETPVDASYLADGVILLRFVEFKGEVRQVISVLKKRSGNHERAIRELRITSEGLRIGEPLRQFRSVLSGIPIPDDDEAMEDLPRHD